MVLRTEQTFPSWKGCEVTSTRGSQPQHSGEQSFSVSICVFNIFCFIEVKFTSHKISIHHLKVNNAVTFSLLTMLCDHHLHLVLRHF